MKTFRLYIYILFSLIAVACMKDGDIITATMGSDNQMNVSSANDNIVLGNDQNSTLVLTLYWNELGQVSLDNQNVSMPNGILAYTLQFSADEEFTTIYEHSVKPDAMSAQFTGSELNTILSKLEYPGGTPLPLYIRMKMQLGVNNEPEYGDAMSITVTAFAIDMSIVQLVDKNDMTKVAGTISATGTKGEYAGFVSVASWYNFYFMEGDGTVWGNDGVSGIAFQTSNDASTQWNCWFPAPKGFYYVTLSTNAKEWTAMSIPTVKATIEGNVLDMKYSSTLNCWSVVFTTSAADAAIGLDQSGTYYDQITGDGAGIEKSFSFKAASDGTFAKAESGAESGITVSTAGTYTLILYFNDMKWELAEGEKQVGGEEEAPTITSIHIVGDFNGWALDDLMTFDSESKTWSATITPDAWGMYGMKFLINEDWSWCLTDTDMDGYLEEGTAEFMPEVPAGKTYKVTLDLNDPEAMTYKLEEIQ